MLSRTTFHLTFNNHRLYLLRRRHCYSKQQSPLITAAGAYFISDKAQSETMAGSWLHVLAKTAGLVDQFLRKYSQHVWFTQRVFE